MTTYAFGLRCNMTQKPMIVLTGPTAVGKTALSIELAKKNKWCYNIRGFHAGIQIHGYRLCEGYSR